MASAVSRRISGYLPTLDGWRAVAILIVVVAHLVDSIIGWLGSGAESLRTFSHYGGVGVNIFFAISGLLITTRLLHGSDERGRFSLRSFYVRRIFRILPPFAVLIGVLSLLLVLRIVAVSGRDIVRAVVLASNYGPEPGWYLAHTWSLSLEEHFYLLWPLFLLWLTPRRAIPFAIVACLCISVWRVADIHFQIVPPTAGVVSWRTDTQVDCILWGAVIACILQVERTRGWLVPLISPSLTIVLLALFIGSIVALGYWPRLQHLVRFFQPIIIGLVLAGTVLHSSSKLGKILEMPCLRWIGRISYSLYLWQQLFLIPRSEFAQSPRWIQTFPVNIVAAFAFAAVSYYVIERPAIALGHRLVLGRSELQRAEKIDEARISA
jgi:peptidoglycan/LPS O-acetylase OafA/YrhL